MNQGIQFLAITNIVRQISRSAIMENPGKKLGVTLV